MLSRAPSTTAPRRLLPVAVPDSNRSHPTSLEDTPLSLWLMLLALLSAFAMGQAYRTVTAIMATGLQGDFGLSASSLGTFAGVFGLAFGVTQFFIGIGMDLYGLRRTVLTAFPLAIAGAVLSAAAPNYQRPCVKFTHSKTEYI